MQILELNAHFLFQTPSAVNKIKQLLKDKPEHVSKTNQIDFVPGKKKSCIFTVN